MSLSRPVRARNLNVKVFTASDTSKSKRQTTRQDPHSDPGPTMIWDPGATTSKAKRLHHDH